LQTRRIYVPIIMMRIHRMASRRAEHAAIARMSRRGQQRIAEGSGHHIQIERPDLVVGAIRDVLGMLK
jgi:pimeloyl-ACP methyl ester carboxylesterase